MWCKTWKIFLLTCLVALATLPSSVNADIGLAPAVVVLSMAVLVIVVLVFFVVLIEVIQVCYLSHCRTRNWAAADRSETRGTSHCA